MKKERKLSVSRTWIHGVAKRGCTDTVEMVGGKNVIKKSYNVWRKMLDRCYDLKFQEQYPSYKGCTVCNEWLFYSNFEIWYNKNIPDKSKRWEIDKDILVQGNKEYSPEACCFVPQKINSLLTNTSASRGKYPVGVTFSKKSCSFRATYSSSGKKNHKEGFSTAGEAFEFYKKFKYKSIKDTADAALKEDLINEKIYNSLLGYQIEDPVKYNLILDDTLPYTLILKDGQKVIHEFNKVSDLLSKTGLTKTQVSNVFVGEIKKGWRLGYLSSKDVRY